ncbi:MAG: hypothetical protein KF912_13520 [Phycisphaeraceae bacterium]|nr:hypothetical protein [Phycisphaeraceae bacterium]MBX3368326.1 hypothetical protein [Phycisphaeraceae bacterium]QYK48888.1 MAG: hypothetical protein KF838_03335 [Phycisphaeraceae bacterium]
MKLRSSLLTVGFGIAIAAGIIAFSIRPTASSRAFSVSMLVDGDRCVYYPNGFDSDPLDPGFDVQSEMWAFKRHDATLHVHQKAYAFSPSRRGSRTQGTPIVTYTWATLDSPRVRTAAGRAAPEPTIPDLSTDDMAALQAYLAEDQAFRRNPAYFETIPHIREHALNYFAGQWPTEVAMIRADAPPVRTFHPRGLAFPAIILLLAPAAMVGQAYAHAVRAKRRAAQMAEGLASSSPSDAPDTSKDPK